MERLKNFLENIFLWRSLEKFLWRPFFLEIAWKIFVKTFFFFGDRLKNFCKGFFIFFWRSLFFGEHLRLCPWPWECLSSERLSLASSLVSSTPPLVITTYLLWLRKHQYLKHSIYFCVEVGQNHHRGVNHLPLLQNFKKCFGTPSIDKFSFRISMRKIILVVKGRECDKQIDYFRAIRAGTELYRSWILYVIVL